MERRARTKWRPRPSTCAQWPSQTLRSENFQMYRQILFWVLPDGFDQFLTFGKQLVCVVVQRWVVQEFPGCSLSRIQPVSNVRDTGHGVLQLVGEFLILGELS